MADFKRATLRKIFEDAGLEIPPKDVLGQICDLHTSGLDELGDTISELNNRLTAAERERDAMKDGGGGDWKEKYDSLKNEYDGYRSQIDAEKTKTAKESAYRELLTTTGISPKYINTVIRADESVIDGLELADGKIKDAEMLANAVKTNWGDFIAETAELTAAAEKPPSNNGGSAMTKDQIYKRENGRYVLSAAERQAELAKQLEQGDID